MDLSASLKSLFVETAQTLKGHARRRFMAQTVKELGSGGQRRAERELGASDELFVYGSISKVTSDCLVDRLVQCWESVRERFGYITTLVINLDNGPENHSRRTQFMQRLVDFVRQYGISVRLVYYPPYHSKYNAIERCWGILENHWNGAILDSVEALLNFTTSMTWNGIQPVVDLVTTIYHTGVRLSQQAMAAIEAQIARLPGLDKWFVDITPTSTWED